ECEFFLADVRWETGIEEGPIYHTDVADVTELRVWDATSLAGIEFFTGLRYLSIYESELADVDLSNSPHLRESWFYRTNMTSLNLSNNPNLAEIWIEESNLAALDISNNPFLVDVVIESTHIAALDVSNNPNLIWLELSNNKLTGLDVSNNPQLILLDVTLNYIESLDDVIGWQEIGLTLEFIESGNFRFWPQRTDDGFPLSMFPVVHNFTDVTHDDWFHDYVNAAVIMGLFQDGDMFAPRDVMTRGAFVRTLAELDGIRMADTPAFHDVAPPDWWLYFEAVQWAYRRGIIQGTGGGNFAPHSPVTREQLAVMLYNYITDAWWWAFSEEIALAEITFTDTDSISAWAFDAVSWAYTLGIIQGRADGAFDPRGTVTRAEITAILVRLAMRMDTF
ncbi:MAG: S-layer homology domain-containing protein, partial [Oscillospiraceae bacterium]|nr:S-layer homology domain-containing protein [Oscillospiraceae bacterium]